MSKEPNIYEYETKGGEIRYVVCMWDDRHGQYWCPLTAEERRLNPTGSAWFARSLSYFTAYKTLNAARSAARRLFGYSKLAR